MLLLTLLFGALVGFSLGLTGGGGAIFAVPLLVYGLGVPAREAVGVSLLTVGSTSLVGFVQRARRGMVEFPTGLLFAVAGMIGAPVGAVAGRSHSRGRPARPVRRAHARDRRADVAQGRRFGRSLADHHGRQRGSHLSARSRRQTPADLAMRHAARARRFGRGGAFRDCLAWEAGSSLCRRWSCSAAWGCSEPSALRSWSSL